MIWGVQYLLAGLFMFVGLLGTVGFDLGVCSRLCLLWWVCG